MLYIRWAVLNSATIIGGSGVFRSVSKYDWHLWWSIDGVTAQDMWKPARLMRVTCKNSKMPFHLQLSTPWTMTIADISYTPWVCDGRSMSWASTRWYVGCWLFWAADVSNNAGWASNKLQIQIALIMTSTGRSTLMKESAIVRFTMHWMNINGQENSVPELRHQFNTLRGIDEFLAGLRKDSFLSLGCEALQSRDAERSFVWLWEPDERARSAESWYQEYRHYATHPTSFITPRDQTAPLSIHVRTEHDPSSCLPLAQ